MTSIYARGTYLEDYTTITFLLYPWQLSDLIQITHPDITKRSHFAKMLEEKYYSSAAVRTQREQLSFVVPLNNRKTSFLTHLDHLTFHFLLAPIWNAQTFF